MLPEYVVGVIFNIPVPTWVQEDFERYGEAIIDMMNVEGVSEVQGAGPTNMEYFRVVFQAHYGSDLAAHQRQMQDVLWNLRPAGEGRIR